MKTLCIASLFATALLLQAAKSPDVELIGHWKLDETSGGTAADSAPDRREGKISGKPERTTGKSGGAFTFGGNSWIELPNSKNLDQIQEGSYAIVAWFKPEIVPPGTENSANDSEFGIVMKSGWHEGLSYNHQKQFTMTHWLAGDSDPVWNGIGTWEDEYQPGQWYHLAGVVDQKERTVQIFVNGELRQTSEPWASGAKSRDYEQQTWKIGAANPGSDQYAWYSKGAIDDVRLYKGALSEAQIKKLYSEASKNAAK